MAERRRCAEKRAPLRLLLSFSVLFCCLTTTIQAHAQFTNLRIFRAGDLLNKDYWRPVKSFKNNDDIDPGHLSSRKSEIGASSPIKRVSMATLLQQLNLSSTVAKKDEIPIIANEEKNFPIPVAIDTSDVTSSVVKESPIRRIKLPAGSIYYSRNFNNSFARGPVIQVSINPHLSSSTTTTTTTAATQSTTLEEELTTTTTTEPSTTTTEPPTTTTTASTTNETPTAKSYVKAKQQPAKVYPIGKAKAPASLRANNVGSGKKLSEMQNSPIYYVKLPASAFVSSARTPYSDDSLPYFKQSPIFVATTRRPGTNSSSETTTTATEEPSDSLSTTTRRPTRTNSRIINIKGPFVFNGKPGGIYSAPAPYRPPNYLDILHSIYPKLKRAQFIRRR